MKPSPIVLIGLPAVGKSSVGTVLAEMTGRPFVDLDSVIEAETGTSIPETFQRHGEAHFRTIESDLLARVLQDERGAVVAGGGGLVVEGRNRRLLAAQAQVIWLDVAVPALIERLAGDSGRPLLEGDPSARLVALHRERLAYYSTAADHIIVDDGTAPEADIAAQILTALKAGPGPAAFDEFVDFGDERSYSVLVGRDVIERLPSLIPDGVGRVAVVTQEGIDITVDVGVENRVFVVENGEGAKRLQVVGDLASEMAQWGLTRGDAIVSVGGGVVSDLAGFLAASYHRGVPVIHVSTTLLGQIDAAIGGKCGVNLPEGKNLLGAFKQPAAVICDTATLASLPPAEFVSGMGELAKYHFLGGDHLDRLPLAERVAACVRIKADVVVDDEREGGRRAILNYGHTLAHAIETETNHQIRHGEAVAVGLVYAAELARQLGRIDETRVAEHRRVVNGYGLESVVPEGLDPERIVHLFSKDKKAIDGITFVLDGPNGVEPVLVEDTELLMATMERVAP